MDNSYPNRKEEDLLDVASLAAVLEPIAAELNTRLQQPTSAQSLAQTMVHASQCCGAILCEVNKCETMRNILLAATPEVPAVASARAPYRILLRDRPSSGTSVNCPPSSDSQQSRLQNVAHAAQCKNDDCRVNNCSWMKYLFASLRVPEPVHSLPPSVEETFDTYITLTARKHFKNILKIFYILNKIFLQSFHAYF